MDLGQLIELVSEFRQGRLSDDAIHAGGGHGAAIAADYPGHFHFLAVTGPRRALAAPMEPYFAVPLGNMMLSGAFGRTRAEGTGGAEGKRRTVVLAQFRQFLPFPQFLFDNPHNLCYT